MIGREPGAAAEVEHGVKGAAMRGDQPGELFGHPVAERACELAVEGRRELVEVALDIIGAARGPAPRPSRHAADALHRVVWIGGQPQPPEFRGGGPMPDTAQQQERGPRHGGDVVGASPASAL